MKRALKILAGAALLVFGQQMDASAAVDELVVVVNKANPAKTLTREELRPIFQTVKTQWSDGTRAMPYNLPETDPSRQGFDAAVLGLDPDRVARYWVDRKIRGGERPPTKLSAPAAVLRSVAANAGGVGYMKVEEANPTVKIVARIRGGLVVSP